MKRRIGLAIAATLLGTVILSGCQNTTAGTDSANTASEVQPDVQEPVNEAEPMEEQVYKVTFYDTDGTTVLSEEEVKSGDTVTEYTPEKENQIFMGWFATPTLAHEFDFGEYRGYENVRDSG